MIVSKKAVAAYLARRLDNHLWMKKLSKEQILDELKRLRVRPTFKTDSWIHQLVCFWLGIHYPKFMFALGMGAGKTKITADIYTQLLRERKVQRGLIVTPRAINLDTWENDLLKNSDLEPWLINVTDINEKLERFQNPRGDLTIIDFPSLQWVLCAKEKINKKKSMLVIDPDRMQIARGLYGDFLGIDESHKLINRDSLWWQMVHGLSEKTTHVYGGTGTMFDADIEEAYSQMHLVDHGATFGTNVGVFRHAFMTKKIKQFAGEVWTPDKQMAPDFHRILQHRSINYEEKELHDLPERMYVTEKLRMGEEQRDHYLRAVEGVINAGGEIAELDNNWLRMRQITSGYLRWKDGTGDHKILFQDNPKLNALERILDELNWRLKVIVLCDYTDTGLMLTEHLKKLGVGHCWYYGGTKDKVATKNRFLDERDCRVMVANSEAVGTGTDGLQAACRYMVFYENPTPPKTRFQTEKRIHRPGMSVMRPYYYDLICRNSIDMGIIEGHKEGLDFYQTFMSGRTRGRGFLIGR